MNYKEKYKELVNPKKFGLLSIEKSVSYMHTIMNMYYDLVINEPEIMQEYHEYTKWIAEKFLTRITTAIANISEVTPDWKKCRLEIWNSIDIELLGMIKATFAEIEVHNILKNYGYYCLKNN